MSLSLWARSLSLWAHISAEKERFSNDSYTPNPEVRDIPCVHSQAYLTGIYRLQAINSLGDKPGIEATFPVHSNTQYIANLVPSLSNHPVFHTASDKNLGVAKAGYEASI